MYVLVYYCYILPIQWMEEILHHLGWLKPYRYWDKPPVYYCYILPIQWMEEILHHLGWLKPYRYWDKPPINWCRISQPSTVCFSFSHGHLQLLPAPQIERWVKRTQKIGPRKVTGVLQRLTKETCFGRPGSCGSCGDFTMRNGENNRDSTDLAIILMLVQWDGNRMGGYSSWASLLGEGYAHGYNWAVGFF